MKKKKVFILIAVLFVSLIRAYAMPVRIMCENGTEHMAYAQDIEEALDIADALCSM